MRRVRRYIKATVDARRLKRLRIRLGIATAVVAQFSAAITDENQFIAGFECRQVGDVGQRDAAAAEKADMRGVGELLVVGRIFAS